MEPLTTLEQTHIANLKFLETQGLYSSECAKWINADNANKMPSTVIAPLELWMNYVSSAGIANVRLLLNTVLGEFNAMQNHWSLTHYYRALGSGMYTTDQVLDLFMDIEDGHRKNGAVEFVRQYKHLHGNSVDNTVQAIGGFASLLMLTSSFFTELLRQLDGYSGGYYSRMCIASIASVSLDSLVLDFSLKNALSPLVHVRSLESELGLVCSGNAMIVKQIRARDTRSYSATPARSAGADRWLDEMLDAHKLISKYTLKGKQLPY